MPANYDFAFANAMEKYDKARTLEEKIAALEEMQSTQPAHKGAEKLRVDISKRLLKLKEKQEHQQKVKGGAKNLFFTKEGVATVVLVGLPNTGKSTLLSKLTCATPAIGNYNFTTVLPELGIMDYKGIKIQIVELPAIIEGSHKGKARGKEVLSLVRNADLVVYVLLGTEQEITKQISVLNSELTAANIVLNKKKPIITIAKAGAKGIEIGGEKNIVGNIEDLKKRMVEKGYVNAFLRVDEKLTVEDIIEGFDKNKYFLKVIGVWVDGTVSKIIDGIPVFPFSDLEKTKELLYNNLNLITIYTRKPGEKDIDNIPIALKFGATIEDLCKILHKDFVKKFKYARVWGSAKHPGQQVSLDFSLKPNDVVELYIRN